MKPQPDNPPPESPKPRAHYRAKGKIASLPRHQRDAFNLLLLDGSTDSIVIQKTANGQLGRRGVSVQFPDCISGWACYVGRTAKAILMTRVIKLTFI
jgi:hypothetical protein